MIGPATGEGRENRPLGTVVVLYLPRCDRPLDVPAAIGPPIRARDDAGRPILLVEDNAEVAAITTETLESRGYEVVHVDRARKGLDLLTQSGRSFGLLLTDVVMPDGMNGLDLAATARRRLPSLPIILMSGYNDAMPERASAFRMLRKPVPAEQLMQAVLAEVAAYPRVVVDNRAREAVAAVGGTG